jgi:hypothetical protein
MFGQKLQVNERLLEARKKFDQHFHPDKYIPTKDYTSPSVLKEFRKYFLKEMRVPITIWKLLFPDYPEKIIDFVQNELNPIFHGDSSNLFPAVVLFVYHAQNGDILPILNINDSNYLVYVSLIYYYDRWLVSVSSKIELNFDISNDIFDANEQVEAGNDFPSGLLYSPLSENHTLFSFTLYSEDNLRTFCLRLRDFLSQ